MCGINGIIKNINIEESSMQILLQGMNQKIRHRGPDEEGFFVEKNQNHSIGMAMTRLSIIDLQTGSQPMFSEDKTLVIVFNGEIYNFLKLRAELKAEGIRFNTTSDTEVILKLYEKYDTDAFKMLDGMYAFSIYDKNKNKIYIARDFFGEKPLYYTRTDKDFYWASELKSIMELLSGKPEISKPALELFFSLTYIPAPYTIYENIFKLEANSYLEYDLSNDMYNIKTIHPEQKTVKQKIDFSSAKKKVYELMQDSVSTRAIADVEIGTFLSGGVDSSIVSLLLAQQTPQPINTFSIGFKKKSFDETDKSRVVAKLINSKHQEFVIDEVDIKNHIDAVLLNFDEPFADSSALPTYLVAQKTSKHVKVALTGDGGDEVFGGYNKYYMGKINQKYTQFIPSKVHNGLVQFSKKVLPLKEDTRGLKFKLHKLLSAIDYANEAYWNIISLGFKTPEVLALLKQDRIIEKDIKTLIPHIDWDQVKTLSDFRKLDRLVSLEGDMLVKVDRTSMLNSLETRSPFLNKKIWDFTMSLPEEYLIKGNNKKYILKKSFEKYFPDKFLDKSKKGFGVPVGDWLRGSLKQELLMYIDKDFLSKQNIFNIDYVRNLVLDHIDQKKDASFKVWTFFVFQKWYTKNYLF